MRRETAEFRGFEIPVTSANTVVLGAGAAGLNCAVHLHLNGQSDVVVASDDLEAGTSRRAGSDKQTYYRISLAGGIPDSPLDLAQALFAGGAMHGDLALVEATLSGQEFYHLVSLGVPFPHDRYGAYFGYKTDHDPRRRGTSAGPLTSRRMHEKLLHEARSMGIAILDGMEAIALLRHGDSVVGALCLDRSDLDAENVGMRLFNCTNLVFATGGPGDLYRASVYPRSQHESIGLALEVGARCRNLTEWQYGLCSTKFRWNVSGSYQQSIPTYRSTDQGGGDEREFLSEFFPSPAGRDDCVFLKGYQWPFDARKIDGSSLIDLLVHRETVCLGRRVFLDYRRNPHGFSFSGLGREAHEYLERCGALLDSPVDRLDRMNPSAIGLYRENGIDLEKEPLEVAVCAQHNNGGLAGDTWWESNVRHLFPVGEANGSHGVYRPGGSALNSGQVGGYRAAEFISSRYRRDPPPVGEFMEMIGTDLAGRIGLMVHLLEEARGSMTPEDLVREIQDRMTSCAAHVRSTRGIGGAVEAARGLVESLPDGLVRCERSQLLQVLRALRLAKTHLAYLEAIQEYLGRGGGSRGSFLVLDPEGRGSLPALGPGWRFRPFDGSLMDLACEMWFEDHSPRFEWSRVRPIPEQDDWFETIWRDFREGRVLDRD
jgi:succinate dehydrogenase/fumarate reductase flavoprotein subunit